MGIAAKIAFPTPADICALAINNDRIPVTGPPPANTAIANIIVIKASKAIKNLAPRPYPIAPPLIFVFPVLLSDDESGKKVYLYNLIYIIIMGHDMICL